MNGSSATIAECPKVGPEPTLISRKEVDALYETMAAIVAALQKLDVDYIVTGGSLLGAVRQHSILFCDDDIDIAIIDRGAREDSSEGAYDRVSRHLGQLLGKNYTYSKRPWEGGDKVRPVRVNTVFVDIFTLRRYDTIQQFRDVIAVKRNGQPQSEEYIQNIINIVQEAAYSQNETAPLCPFWQFNTRKAIEMWPKEVYRQWELFPLSQDYKFGPMVNINGPRMPVLLLKRAFGADCFDVCYQSGSHSTMEAVASLTIDDDSARMGTKTRREEQRSEGSKQQSETKEIGSKNTPQSLRPRILKGGMWQGGRKVALKEEHYCPMQPVSRAKRRPTLHDRSRLFDFLADQIDREKMWQRQVHSYRPKRTVYMDGVFDLFHVGHVEAIRQCAALGNRVIIGVTGDADAANYKRAPIVSQADRIAVVGALRDVDEVICPCPLICDEEFMKKHGIDLVVHGFADDVDAKRQEVFFEVPINAGKFQRIDYYKDLSTTDIISKIQSLPSKSHHS